MKNKFVRKIALYTAFLQIFASSAMATDNDKPQDYSLQTKIVSSTNKDKFIRVNDDDNCPIYYQLDTETGEYRPISIFNYDNTYSHQFGANQEDLSNNFNKLINNPIIWEEMQKYYPVDKFDSYEEAMYFYAKYFDIIKDCGCGYAAATNYIFHMFEGREEDFYKAFGYPMYTINNNIIDFNYEMVMLEFFNFSNLKVHKSYKLIERSMARDFLEYKLNLYKEQHVIKNPTSEEKKKWTQDDWNIWREEGHIINKTIAELQEKVNNATNLEINLGIAETAVFGDIKAFLANHKINVSVSLKYGLGNPTIDDIVASDYFELYETNDNKFVKRVEDVDLHYIYITEIKEDGTILVSSWGNMYIYDNSKATDTQKIIIKSSK